MCSWWIYIRGMFEEPYRIKGNYFECVRKDVENGNSSCICIPAVAVNYIAGEIKFWEKENNTQLTWRLAWEPYRKIYLVEKDDCDWNSRLYDISDQGKSCIGDAEICSEDITDYVYIKLRDFSGATESADNSRKYLYQMKGSEQSKIEIEIYTILARDFRTAFLMKEYIDKLFRFLFFLHPYEGLKVIERSMKQCDDRDLKRYNKKILDDYQKLIADLKKIYDSRTGVNLDINKMLTMVGAFVGVKILSVYVDLKESEQYGDIRTANEMFQEKVNDTLKLGALGNASRINKIMNEYLLTV